MAEGPPDPRGPRPRELGVLIGELEPGPSNSIADVEGVRVGHVTVWRDDPLARTGVTAIVPASLPLPAGVSVLNGAGELTGSHEIREWGGLTTPVYLTSTHAVGRVYDGAVALAVRDDPKVGVERFVIPVVGECDDSWLSDARSVHVTAEDVARAHDEATAWPFAEGAVGAGTGMSCLGWKGGIGSASRVVGEHVVGVLVLANYGAPRQLTVAGVPLGRELDPGGGRDHDAGSCIVVVATDAPVSPPSLERVARRAGLGLARTGSVAHHGSGEIFLGFSTKRGDLDARGLDPLFEATVEATEEAVLNALWAAPDVTGRAAHLERGLPHDEVLELLRKRGALT